MHGPSVEWKKDKAEGYKTKIGLYMVAIYTTLYLVFVFLCVLEPKLVGKSVGSINIAIAYGMALIVIAIIMALIYNNLCNKREKYHDDIDEGKTEASK